MVTPMVRREPDASAGLTVGYWAHPGRTLRRSWLCNRMSRVFLSHSSRDNRHAIALKRWLEQAEPGLAGEIYLDLDPDTGIGTGMRWTEALWQVNARCEAVICLLSSSWAASAECHAEYRQAEGMHKPIFCARIEDIRRKGRDPRMAEL